jgi:hypothetical protein
MVYAKKFVAVVKINGRILREFNHENISDFESECSLILPFGTEYTLLFKNLESRSARLNLWIDGEDVLSGNALLVHSNSSVELNGFMNSAGTVTHKFKFIQKTEKIIQHRGDKIDDGMIRVEWVFEKEKPVYKDVFTNHHDNWIGWRNPYRPWPYNNPW